MGKLFKTIIIVIFAAVVVGGAYFLFLKKSDNLLTDKSILSNANLVKYVTSINDLESQLKSDPNNIETYTNLGMAWKELADYLEVMDKAKAAKYYSAALSVYEQGIEKSQRKNTLFMSNAANMAKHLGDYAKAEEFYKEALVVAPGDYTLYQNLADLYENYMKKGQADVLAVYESGKNRVIDKSILEKMKAEYLKRNSEN